MDAVKCKALTDIVDVLTTSGEPKLEDKKIKELKKICRSSDEYVSHCFELVWSQLKREHAEIRLSSFQIIDELFRRSHQFRMLLLDNFQTYLELTLEIDLDQPLPPPKAAAEKLKNSSYQALKEWHQTYSSGYRKLELAYNYLRNCHQVDFNKADHMNALQRQREREAELQAEAQRNRRIEKIITDINENESDIQTYVTQLSTCLKLLLPSQDVFDAFDEKIFDKKPNSVGTDVAFNGKGSEVDEEFQEHGMRNRRAAINVTLTNRCHIVETEENTDIIHNLDEVKVMLAMKYRPMIVRWLQVLQKNGARQELLTRVIDLKSLVSKTLGDLDVMSIQRIRSEDSDDDDFMEVPEEVDEVSILKSRLGMTGKSSTSEGSQASTSRHSLHSTAPVLDYDLDLEYWENPEDLKIPERQLNDAARFWISADRDFTMPSSLEELYSSRKIDFSGKFVPVKWTCRAPLPNGRLCPRMDRVKCPFHGPIIARNDDGSPANFADAEKLEKIKLKQRQENPEWQDPSLLADIKSQTGINLKIEKRRSDKKKSKLTNISKPVKTSRDRLESKVLSRRALKRVAGALNTLDQKRLKDKFCHSFTATFNK